MNPANPPNPPNAPAGPSSMTHRTLDVDINGESSYPVILPGVNPQFPRGQGVLKKAPSKQGDREFVFFNFSQQPPSSSKYP
ncbi:MAG: hypothetical protein Q9208_004257 [Pyrenodesmia sp. 3 TL-2023]